MARAIGIAMVLPALIAVAGIGCGSRDSESQKAARSSDQQPAVSVEDGKKEASSAGSDGQPALSGEDGKVEESSGNSEQPPAANETRLKQEETAVPSMKDLIDPKRPANEAAREKMKTKRVSFTFIEQPPDEALIFLGLLSGLSTIVDKRGLGYDAQVSLQKTDVPVGKALEEGGTQVGLTCVLLDGVVFFTSEQNNKRLREGRWRVILPANLSTEDRRLLGGLVDKRVSMRVDGQSFAKTKELLEDLAAKTGVPMKVRKATNDEWGHFILLNEVPAFTALLLVAEIGDFYFTVDNGEVVIGDEKTIREIAERPRS